MRSKCMHIYVCIHPFCNTKPIYNNITMYNSFYNIAKVNWAETMPKRCAQTDAAECRRNKFSPIFIFAAPRMTMTVMRGSEQLAS